MSEEEESDEESDEEEEQVQKISAPIIVQYEPPREHNVVKFEASDELSNDVWVEAG